MTDGISIEPRKAVLTKTVVAGQFNVLRHGEKIGTIYDWGRRGWTFGLSTEFHLTREAAVLALVESRLASIRA